AEFVSSGIQGSPILSVGVRTGAVPGSKIVGGSGKCGCSFCGSVGFTSTIEECGGRFPLVAGIGFWSPPLPVPPDGCALVRLRMSGAESLYGPNGVVSPGKGGLVTPFVFARIRRITAKTAA